MIRHYVVALLHRSLEWTIYDVGEQQIEDAARVGQQSKIEQAFMFCGCCSEKIVEEIVKV